MITKQQIELAEERVRVETALTDFIQHCWDFWQRRIAQYYAIYPAQFCCGTIGGDYGWVF